MVIQPSFNIRVIQYWFSETFGELNLSRCIDMISNSNWLGFQIDYETDSLFGKEGECFEVETVGAINSQGVAWKLQTKRKCSIDQRLETAVTVKPR